jgi:hypothetical protein
MDPFEQKVQALLNKRLIEAQQRKQNTETNNYETEEDTQLPYNISKTVQYLNQEAYLQKRKALKKLKDNI